MFNLTLNEHLRLMFGHVIDRQRAHAAVGEKYARWSRWQRALEALLVAGVAGSSTAAAFGKGSAYVVASAILASLALAVLLLHLAFDLDVSAEAHRTCATRLWRIREQYRVLLTDLADGTLDIDAVQHKRDALMNELHAIYEHAPLARPRGYEAGATSTMSAAEGQLTDKEIDSYLPKSLHKTEQSPAA